GYTLVATNREGFNAFFMRKDCLAQSGLKELDVTIVLQERHIRSCFYSQEIMKSLLEKTETR
ncbi:MAG: hypothetical protein J7578_12260, partial [Chitinophagaceae bacterium]|nr:hypothetical protein [Chitinophagaceae bacterium]